MMEPVNKIQCGSTVVDLSNICWADSNKDNVPDEGEVSAGKDKYLSADELKCYREIVGSDKLKPSFRNYDLLLPAVFNEWLKEAVHKVVDRYASRFEDGILSVNIITGWYSRNYDTYLYHITISGIESASCRALNCSKVNAIHYERTFIDYNEPFLYTEVLPFLELAFKEALGIEAAK